MASLTQDFEEYLDESFNVVSFANTFLKATNQVSKNTLDFNTPIKKLDYDLQEIESRLESIVKSNYQHLLNQLQNSDEDTQVIQKVLNPSLEYIDLSYNRLSSQVLIPYQKATNLQLALKKLHETSTLLRSFFTISSLILQAQSINIDSFSVNSVDGDSLTELDNSVATISTLTGLHQQIELHVNSNNLSKLEIIANVNREFLQPQKLILTKKITEFINKIFAKNHTKLLKYNDALLQLFQSLSILNQNQLLVTLDKIILSKSTVSSQILNKSIVNIKKFEANLHEIIVTNMKSIVFLEYKILKHLKWRSLSVDHQFDNSPQVTPSTSTFVTLNSTVGKYLQHYQKMSPSADAYSSVLFIYWQKVSKSFAEEFEANVKRGGPVGKSLAASRETLTQSIKKELDLEIPDNYADKGSMLAIMEKSVQSQS